MAPLLELRGDSLSFGAVRALRDVSLARHAGEVHALAGENVFLGRQSFRVDRSGMRRAVGELFARLGVPIDPDRPTRGLSIADQQVIEIARALAADARIIVIDEPTAALSEVEAERLFRVARALGIIASTTVGIAAAARYLSTTPEKGKVMLTGLGTPDQMRQFVKDGTVKEFALWDPNQLGYLAGYAAAALCSGQISGAEGEALKAGRLGERKIGKNGEIILGPPTVFNARNIDQFDC